MLDSIFSWSAFWWLMFLLYLPACLGLVVIVLLQKGKGAGFAGAFGVGGGSDTVFGPRMAKSLPQKLTYTMAGIFMVLALVLSLVGGKASRGGAPREAEIEAAAAGTTASFDDIFKTPAPAAQATAPAESAPETPAPAAEAAVPVAPAESAPETLAPATDAALPETPDSGAPTEAPAAETAPETPAPATEAAPVDAAPSTDSAAVEEPPVIPAESQ